MKTCTSATLLVLAGAAIACDAPDINPTTLEVIKKLEGFRAELYDDGYGTQHVGYGHACQKKDCAEVKYPIPISNADAEKLLLADLKGREGCVAANVENNIVLNANQYGALVSFVFNVGCGNFADSTLLKRLNAGEKPSTVVEEELPQWKLAGGKVAPGLVERRKQEIALFNTPSSEPALPACDDEPTPTPTPTNTAKPTSSAEPTSTDATSTQEPSSSSESSTAPPDTTLSTSVSTASGTQESTASEPVSTSHPTSSKTHTGQPTSKTTSTGGSTGTIVTVKPTCTAGSCVPVVTGSSAKLQVGSLAAVAAVIAALF